MSRSFVRQPAAVPAEGAAARAAAAAGAEGAGGATSGPVDLDWNLVQNLLSSYSFEQGSPAHPLPPFAPTRTTETLVS